ncbi:acetyltransferase, partial [Streptomyces sp. NRRL F-6602]
MPGRLPLFWRRNARHLHNHAMEPITLTTARLTLRALATADVDAVYRACQDPEIRRWTTVPSPYRRADAEHFVTRICEDG